MNDSDIVTSCVGCGKPMDSDLRKSASGVRLTLSCQLGMALLRADHGGRRRMGLVRMGVLRPCWMANALVALGKRPRP